MIATASSNRAIVREGKPYPPDSVAALEILAGVPDAPADLKAAGFLLLVVANQPDVAKGIELRAVVEAIHQRLQAELPLDAIPVCYHQDSDRCNGRKPAPGYRGCSKRQPHAMSYTYLSALWWEIGGEIVDAGCRAGCQTILLDYGDREQAPENEPAARFGSLREAADWILWRERKGQI